MPAWDNENPKVGGTPEAANNKFNSGAEPDMGVESIRPFSKASDSKGQVNESTLSTKETVIGGTPMSK